MIDQSVKVACRRCGKQCSSKDMVLDSVYKMMVCPLCVKERKLDELKQKQGVLNKNAPQAADPKNKPAGWDAEDEFLEQAVRVREQNRVDVKVQKIDNEKVKYACPKCKYSFVYNQVTNHPASCPYCGASIFKFRI